MSATPDLDVGAELAELGQAMRQARTLLYDRVVAAVHAGTSEAEAARASGLDRMTVRRLLGKRR